jgi:hypothetical protein
MFDAMLGAGCRCRSRALSVQNVENQIEYVIGRRRSCDGQAGAARYQIHQQHLVRHFSGDTVLRRVSAASESAPGVEHSSKPDSACVPPLRQLPQNLTRSS